MSTEHNRIFKTLTATKTLLFILWDIAHLSQCFDCFACLTIFSTDIINTWSSNVMNYEMEQIRLPR